ncbi:MULTISPECIES: alginate lyase family protein [unclassified Duganella]|uniref:alginate lyase family protein n=1 Tax=unclassified Duganella TaxID=2636909 RepID=UPI000E345DF5|nr:MULTISPECIES: alginate lyase family protein [unclassified Duganella]RFP10115.1 alginate lyase [Duganella sp. BJB475]RFP25579.1 alginate lyase [Duganella sp. BJB476]
MKRAKLFTAWLLALAFPAAMACTTPPPAVIDIDANGYYSDAHHSVIDPVLRARNIANTKPIDDFLAEVAKNASQGSASCALGWLESWAGQRALLGKLSSEQAWYVRKWTLGGMALSYARVKQAATPAQQQAIEAWFKMLVDATMAHSDAHKGTRNNHYYWEGLAVTAVGGVTHDERYLAWGRKVFEHAMGQVAADGSLPAEMERAAKALHYHVFAAVPLVMSASILDLHSAKLDQLMRFTLAAAQDPSAMEKATGFAQERANASEMSFAILYARHEGRAELMPAKANFQPRLGGDLNLANPLEHLAPGKSQ